MLKKGIIIFALKHTLYGRLAYNLVVSIKAVEDFPVTVIRSGKSLSHLSESQLKIFDNVIDLPEDAPNSCGAKMWVDLLSPYEETLLLDADMIWFPYKKPSELFDYLSELDFTAPAEGYHVYQGTDHKVNELYYFWADPNEIGAVYGLPKGRRIYQWRSETLYFKKTEEVKSMFQLARKVFLKPGLTTMKTYATGVADELGLNVACAVHDLHPHVLEWHPAYWHMLNGGHVPELQGLYHNYYLATFGSNIANSQSKLLYDKLMRTACYKQGLSHVFPLQSKRESIPERVKI